MWTEFTGVSGSGVADIVGCSDVLCIPWLFLEGLPGPVVRFMSVINLLIPCVMPCYSQKLVIKCNCNTMKDNVELSSIQSSYPHLSMH